MNCRSKRYKLSSRRWGTWPVEKEWVELSYPCCLCLVLQIIYFFASEVLDYRACNRWSIHSFSKTDVHLCNCMTFWLANCFIRTKTSAIFFARRPFSFFKNIHSFGLLSIKAYLQEPHPSLSRALKHTWRVPWQVADSTVDVKGTKQKGAKKKKGELAAYL